MEKVEEIFGTFFDINLFSLKRILLAVAILAGFFLLKGLFSSVIIKLFKVKGKENVKANNFYKPLRIFFATFGIYIALMTLGPTESFKSLLNLAFRLIIIALATYSIGNLVAPKSQFEKFLKKKISKANDFMVRMICKTLKATIYIIGGVIIVSELGFNISGIITGIGVIGLAISLAAQDTAENIIGALMILIDKPFEVGDWVAIDTTEGSVEEVTFRSTRIRGGANSVVCIPNSTVVDSPITNWSRLKKRRITMDLTLEFETPLKKIADVQNQILIFLENEENILNEGLYVKFTAIADNGYTLKVMCFTPILNYIDYLSYCETVNFKIMSILNQNKVSLAFTSQTLYLRNNDKS